MDKHAPMITLSLVVVVLHHVYDVVQMREAAAVEQCGITSGALASHSVTQI